MSFYSQVGEVAIGSRLRQLSETLTEGAADIYELYGYRVGVYPQDGLPMTVVHTVVRDIVQRLAANDGLE